MKISLKNMRVPGLALLALFCLFLFGPASAAGQEPFSFTDDRGQEITIESPPQRVVSLVPSVTDMIFKIGAGQSLPG